MSESDTIAAIATAPGAAGVAVIRISGPAALEIADRVFRCRPPPPSERPSRFAVYGRVVSEKEELLDEALLLSMRSPRSFTGEDIVEIQCHGGMVAPRAVLSAICAAGARPAEPGEFTRRAFQNGKLDLTQAEAILDLVQAQSIQAAEVALRQLEGGLRVKVEEIYRVVLSAASQIESGIDFSEYIDNESDTNVVLGDIAAARGLIAGLLAAEKAAAVIRNGLRVVIIGPVNAGKSTLFNSLIGRERAIVSHLPGTTRDFIEETIFLGGMTVRLIDTAGLRTPACEVESEGIRRTRQNIISSDAIIYVIDCSERLSESDFTRISELPGDRVVLVLNKIDIAGDVHVPDIGVPVLKVSAKEGKGIQDILQLLADKASKFNAPVEAMVSERHANLLRSADRLLSEAEWLVSKDEKYQAPAGAKLMNALNCIGQITGRVSNEDLLNSIFKRFCIGK